MRATPSHAGGAAVIGSGLLLCLCLPLGTRHALGGVQPPATDKTKSPEAPSKAAGGDRSQPLTAREKLKASAERYSAAKTYRDEGEVRRELEGAGGPISSIMPFRTAFERDGR